MGCTADVELGVGMILVLRCVMNGVLAVDLGLLSLGVRLWLWFVSTVGLRLMVVHLMELRTVLGLTLLTVLILMGWLERCVGSGLDGEMGMVDGCGWDVQYFAAGKLLRLFIRVAEQIGYREEAERHQIPGWNLVLVLILELCRNCACVVEGSARMLSRKSRVWTTQWRVEMLLVPRDDRQWRTRLRTEWKLRLRNELVTGRRTLKDRDVNNMCFSIHNRRDRTH
jgi:hypothetical protein